MFLDESSCIEGALFSDKRLKWENENGDLVYAYFYNNGTDEPYRIDSTITITDQYTTLNGVCTPQTIAPHSNKLVIITVPRESRSDLD